MRLIDKSPPTKSGNAQVDSEKSLEYLVYLNEEINFAFRSIAKQIDAISNAIINMDASIKELEEQIKNINNGV